MYPRGSVSDIPSAVYEAFDHPFRNAPKPGVVPLNRFKPENTTPVVEGLDTPA